VGYSIAPWAGFGEALAAVAGALTGLLFVALSVKSDVLAASRGFASVANHLATRRGGAAAELITKRQKAFRDTVGGLFRDAVQGCARSTAHTRQLIFQKP